MNWSSRVAAPDFTALTGGMVVRFTAAMAASLLLPSSGLGHHSEAGIDTNTVVTFDATVTEYTWRNPHIYLAAETVDEHGEITEWVLQLGSIVIAQRAGWTRDSLSAGDHITVRAHPAQDGRPYGMMESVVKEGEVLSGTQLFTPQITVSASTLEGKWIGDPAELFSYPGGFDGFFKAHLNLTEKGKAAQTIFDEVSDENTDATCVGRPTPALIIASALFPLEIQFDEDQETIRIRSSSTDEERTVYMDGRSHPEIGERFFGGHSLGWWEEDVLVVDTRNFLDHRSPYQIGVPSGIQKHVVERYRLSEDGFRMLYEFTLEDPEYIATPMTYSSELLYSPDMEMTPYDCDPAATRRFVPR